VRHRFIANVADTSQWHVPICQLFEGRIVDQPEEQLVPKTTLTLGGCVEHELFVLGLGPIMLVYELKFHLIGPMGAEEAAQVFMEMHGICFILFYCVFYTSHRVLSTF